MLKPILQAVNEMGCIVQYSVSSKYKIDMLFNKNRHYISGSWKVYLLGKSFLLLITPNQPQHI